MSALQKSKARKRFVFGKKEKIRGKFASAIERQRSNRDTVGWVGG
jgi:hypothetical protein